MVGKHEYMNMGPRIYRVCYATDLSVLRQFELTSFIKVDCYKVYLPTQKRQRVFVVFQAANSEIRCKKLRLISAVTVKRTEMCKTYKIFH